MIDEFQTASTVAAIGAVSGLSRASSPPAIVMSDVVFAIPDQTIAPCSLKGYAEWYEIETAGRTESTPEIQVKHKSVDPFR